MKNLTLITLFSLIALQSVWAQGYLNQDCVGAVPLCLSRYELPYSFSGQGTVDELSGYYDHDSTFCLLNGENNSAWYKLKFNSTGQLVFNILPYGLDDYDFALFDMTGLSCADILSSTAPFVRCNYAAGSGDTTGLAYGSMMMSAGANGEDMLAPLDVDSGDVVYLVIDNFTTNGAGFAIDFTGTTAGIISDDSFYVTSGYTTLLPDTIKVDMFFNQSFYCGTLSSTFDEFTLVSDLGDTLQILSVDCDSTRNKIVVNALYPANPVTSVEVFYQDGFDGNIIIAQCGGAELTGTPKTFEARNAPGMLDFNHVQNSNIFTFTPASPIIGGVKWYINDSAVYVNAPDYGYEFALDANLPYKVCLEADYGYLKDTVCKNYYITGLADLNANSAFSMYPNPAHGEVNINLPFGANTLELTDINGKTVRQLANVPVGKTLVIGTADLPDGLYLVKVAHSMGIAIQKLQVLH